MSAPSDILDKTETPGTTNTHLGLILSFKCWSPSNATTGRLATTFSAPPKIAIMCMSLRSSGPLVTTFSETEEETRAHCLEDCIDQAVFVELHTGHQTKSQALAVTRAKYRNLDKDYVLVPDAAPVLELVPHVLALCQTEVRYYSLQVSMFTLRQEEKQKYSDVFNLIKELSGTRISRTMLARGGWKGFKYYE